MSDHVANGNMATVSRNLGNGVKNAIKRLSEASSSGGDSPDHQSTHALRTQKLGPQISVEQFEDNLEGGSKESTPCPEVPPSNQLCISLIKVKSQSLPAGMILDDNYRHSDGVISDVSDELETTLELDSSVDLDKDRLAVRSTSPKIKVGTHKHLKHSESVNSTISIMESDISSDEENFLSVDKGTDDEVFNGTSYSKLFDADRKLIEWASKEFVPSCQMLLSQCTEGENKSEVIKTQLKDLSNRIIYFSSEHQRLSMQFSPRHGISPSVSTDRFNQSSVQRPVTPVSPSPGKSPMPKGRDSGESQYDHHSYAVKVLRSVSQELIEPLLRDAADFGFTSELYRAIVQAMQKIAWKVEACLSYNDPTKQFRIHHDIFTDSAVEKVKHMMIRASPLNSTPYDLSPLQPVTTETIDPTRIIKRTPSGRLRPAGAVFNSDTIPEEFKVSESNPTVSESTDCVTTLISGPVDTTPTFQRSRMATTGENEFLQWKSRPLSSRYGSNPFLDEEGFPLPTDSTPEYLRPTKPRRTTVSLSRQEVASLGLTVAKHVDETIVTDVSSPLLREPPVINKAEQQRVREKLHAQLTETFGKIREATPPNVQFNRKKSASMSDILDDASPIAQVARKHGNEARQQSLEAEDTVKLSSPGPYSPSYAKNYIALPPGPHATNEKDWVYLNRPEVDPRVSRSSKTKSPSKSGKETKKAKKQHKESDKKKSAEKVSTSGRFSVSLRKTAQALRRMSTSAPKIRES